MLVKGKNQMYENRNLVRDWNMVRDWNLMRDWNLIRDWTLEELEPKGLDLVRDWNLKGLESEKGLEPEKNEVFPTSLGLVLLPYYRQTCSRRKAISLKSRSSVRSGGIRTQASVELCH